MLNTIRRLLPTGRAWNTTHDTPMRRFFAGIGAEFEAVKTALQRVYTDTLPQFTRRLEEYEEQFGLPATNLGEQARRDRLAGAFASPSNQGLDTIQDALQASGFNVYLHNWWVPGTEPAPGAGGSAAVRDPSIIVSNAQALRSKMDAGEALAQAGEALAQAGQTFVDPPPPLGYLLVNIIRTDTGVVEYTIPTDPNTWPHIIYIGGETFGNFAQVPSTRRAEFEALCLRLRPAHKWIGMLVSYT